MIQNFSGCLNPFKYQNFFAQIEHFTDSQKKSLAQLKRCITHAQSLLSFSSIIVKARNCYYVHINCLWLKFQAWPP